MALGHTKLSEISNFVGIEGKKVTRYLDVLQEIGVVVRQVTPTEDPLRFRKGVYCIEDNFLNFWFRFVMPNRSRIEMRDTNDLLYSIMAAMSGYASRTFENISMEFLQAVTAKGRLGVRFTRWGRWWNRENEIDVVALDNDSHDILFCECKWQNRMIGVDVIRQLLDKAPLVKWFNGVRNEHYAVIAKAGFTKKAVAFAKDKGVLLFDLRDMERYFDKNSF